MDSDAPNCGNTRANNEVYIDSGEGEGIEGNSDVEDENSPSSCVRISCMLFSCRADHGLESTVPRTKESCPSPKCLRPASGGMCIGSEYSIFISAPNHFSIPPRNAVVRDPHVQPANYERNAQTGGYRKRRTQFWLTTGVFPSQAKQSHHLVRQCRDRQTLRNTRCATMARVYWGRMLSRQNPCIGTTRTACHFSGCATQGFTPRSTRIGSK